MLARPLAPCAAHRLQGELRVPTSPQAQTHAAAAAALPELIRLEHRAFRLELAPEVGGSIASFASLGDGAPLHWLRPASRDTLMARDPLGMASFPLAPYCNRIRLGRSSYGDLPIDLAPNMAGSPHAIHGTVWRRPWQVEDSGGRSAVLLCEHQPQGPRDWPYPFEARQHLQLDDDGLRVEISIVNHGPHAMPAGLGHHPYFPRTPGTRVQTRVSAMWASDAELLPTGLTHPAFLAPLAEGIALDELVLDNNFIGWSHEARVEWPREGRALLMRAQPPLDFFVLYSPRGADHFCMEPVSNCTDWMNLATANVQYAGGALLPPGGTLVGRFELRPLRLQG
jgi:aldose 1-epimerase